ncbi:putative pyruvate dehydrogenase protein X component [Apostichopus japonicus]|uniref:Dihydrolipoamide acetyltransferase component of pyruvate dehydrogenase complex n=1 Tax=Stichopus japonicus TaxID=307972 RepID=A0A2G8KSR0_STIJA|nr:putative pyruvate dehydrogenase protein X component [Apostichopus japonicus]
MSGIRALPFCWRNVHMSKRALLRSTTVIQEWRIKHLSRSSCLSGVEPMQLLMPALSPTMTEGTIGKWLKREGDTVNAGDALCEVETDKATVTMDADEDGTLAKILIPEGTANVSINKLIALMVAEGEDWKDVEMPQEIATSEPEASPAASEVSQEEIKEEPEKVRKNISPAVRQLLDTHNLDAVNIPSSGPGGILLKGCHSPSTSSKVICDTFSSTCYSSHSTNSTYQPQKTFVDIPLSGMRRTIAKRLTESKSTIPHAYASIDCLVDEVSKLRKQLKKENIKVSVNDFIIKAVAVTLKQMPEVNAKWKDEKIELLKEVDISVAVATENGLITPIVRDAPHLGLSSISDKVRELAVKARSGKLSPQEYQGGSFSISNLGMFGISEFTAVINPPQSCIMAIGGTQLCLDSNSKPSFYMTVQLSSDARVVDSVLASRFLDAFKKNMENPMRLGLL